MALLLFAQTMFGNLIVIRILRRFRDRSLISATSLTKIGTAFALMMSLVVIFLFSYVRVLPIFILSVAILLQVLLKVRENRRVDALAARFPQFLDRWLLNLRTGSANSTARESALNACDEQFRAMIRPLLNCHADGGGALSRETAGCAHLFLSTHSLRELRTIQAEGHNTVARLQNLRKSLRRESDFRRRSGQALRQSAIQSAVLVLMHAALTLFTVIRCGFWPCADLIAVATVLTASGLLILRLMARRIRWTI